MRFIAKPGSRQVAVQPVHAIAAHIGGGKEFFAVLLKFCYIDNIPAFFNCFLVGIGRHRKVAWRRSAKYHKVVLCIHYHAVGLLIAFAAAEVGRKKEGIAMRRIFQNARITAHVIFCGIEGCVATSEFGFYGGRV